MYRIGVRCCGRAIENLYLIKSSYLHVVNYFKYDCDHVLMYTNGSIVRSQVIRRNLHLINRHVLGLVRMPKDLTKPKAELRHIRLKAKAASQKLPSYCVLTALGNGGNGNPRCLYVLSDHATYMFNCGEGTQRLSSEYKIKMTKLEHIFFTYKSWENIGGLPGLSLTIESIGVPSVSLHGPTDICEIYNIADNFMVAKDLLVFQKNLEDGGFSDGCMNVSYVLLRSEKPLQSRNGDAELNAITTETIKVHLPQRAVKRPRKSYMQEEIAVAYICKLHSKPGTLSLEKCVEYNVPPGPLFGELKSGKDIVLPNGEVVKALDVVSPKQRGPIFIVLECPSEDFLDSLMSANAFEAHQMASSEENHASVVVHFSPSNVIATPRYQAWMSKFSASTFHIVLNSDCNSLSSSGAYRIQNMLHVLHPKIFPNLSQPMPANVVQNENLVVYADTMLKVSLWPRVQIDRRAVVALDEEAYIREAKENSEFMESLRELNIKLSKTISEIQPASGVCSVTKGGEIVFLGTGSSIPSKARNVSSILWNSKPEQSVLFDCGEGTYSQLFRFYGHQKVADVLIGMKLIFLSHLHADHHMGLLQILKKREAAFKARNEPYVEVDVLAPIQFAYFFQQYHKVFEPILHLFRLIPSELLVHNNTTMPADNHAAILQKLNLEQLHTVNVRHTKHSFGIVLATDDGWKLVYSGDTMPCQELVNAGQLCSLLIHEATMEDDLEKDAILKTHSTTSQAIDIGNKMKAKFTLLTHFSQRYAKVPLFNENFHNSVGCAFDNMRVTQEDLKTLPLLIPCLKNLFQEHYDDMEDRRAKILRRQQVMNETL